MKWGQICTALAQGATGSAISYAQGGSLESGFLAGFAGGLVAGYMPTDAHMGYKVFAGAIVGGCASMVGGGKFESGAVTGAFVVLVGEGLKVLRDHHYSRNEELLQEYEKLGIKEGERYTSENLIEDFGLRREYKDAYHRIGAKHQFNQKWVSDTGRKLFPFGKIEVIIDQWRRGQVWTLDIDD